MSPPDQNASNASSAMGISFDRLAEAIREGMSFLSDKQLPSGEFVTLLGADHSLQGGVFDSSPFVTAHILQALHGVQHPGIGEVIRKALDYLRSEKELGGVWRYYSRRQWKHCRIPPDLDDTACASHALRLYGEAVPRNEWIFRSCRNEKGLFRTWIASHDRKGFFHRLGWLRLLGDWIAKRETPPKPKEMNNVERFQLDTDAVPLEDCDPVVNANVLLYLGDQPITRQISSYLESVIKEGPVEGYSSYYPSPISLFYTISRAFIHGAISLQGLGPSIIEKTEACQHPDGSWGNPLYTAMGIYVLLAFSGDQAKVERGMSQLLSSQSEDGSWEAEAFYSGPTEFWGSKELTTATVIEAFHQFLRCKQNY